MKSSYELAMERLGKSSPTVKLTDEQKKELAELEAVCVAQIADRELFLKGKIAEAEQQGKFEDVEQLEKQLVEARKTIRNQTEEKKDLVRNRGSSTGQENKKE